MNTTISYGKTANGAANQLESPARIYSEVLTITPAMAQSMLDKSIGNRPINSSRVDAYGEEMRLGNWRLNGEAMLFDADGRFIDGHHRCYACIKFKTPFASVVTYNIADPLAFQTINTGWKRCGGDIFTLAGIPSGRAAHATVLRYLEYLYSVGKPSVSHSNIPFPATATHLADAWNKDAERFIASVNKGQNAYRKLPCANLPMLAACHYMFAQRNERLADKFIEQVGSGESLMHGDPAFMLRDAWIRRSQDKHKENLRNMMVKMVHGWNALRAGRRVGIVRHNSAHPVPAVN